MGVERLGTVEFPSGIALVIDMGQLNLWSHDRPPVMPDGVLSTEEATASANAAEDFYVEGRDAEAAGRAFDYQPHPLFLYDIPGPRDGAFKAKFDAFAREKGFDARLVSLKPRIPHRGRITRAIEFHGVAGEVWFHGVPAVAIGGLPQVDRFAVVGERLGAPPFAECWKWVGVEVRPGAVASSVRAGIVGVDWARLMFVDADAVGAWQHDAPTDGLADFLFWGRDAETLAGALTLKPLEEGQFGWRNLPIDEVVARANAAERLRDENGWKVATDFRPHSHHYALMAQLRATPTQSGVLDVGGARTCAFMTTWGDGLFPVFVDRDAAGAVVRIRVDLATEDAVRNMRRVNGMPDV